MHRHLPWIVLLALTAALPAQEARSDRLTLDLLLEWESVRNPTISPDGSQIVYTRTWTDKIGDRQRSELWIMNADGSRQRALVDGSSPQWSPDGTRLAYIAEGEPKGSQIWVMWIDTREATQITHLTESPGGIRWAPDGESIAFTMQVPEKDGFPIKLPPRPKGAKWAEDPVVITRLSYRRDRRGYRPAGYRHIFVVSAKGGTPRQVTSGDYDHGAPEWTPDGTEILFSGLRQEDADWQVRESEIYAVAVDSGTVRQLTTRKGPDSNPIVSPDGRWVAYTGFDKTDDTYNVSQIHVMAIDGTGHRSLTASLDRQPGSLHWARDSRSILFTVQTEGRVQAMRVGLDGGLETLTAGTHQFRLADVGPDGTLVGTLTSPHEPGDITLRRPDGSLARLTDVHADVLRGRMLGEVEEIWYDSVDGFRVQGWIVKPPDFEAGKRYPLILQIHGGPHGMYGVNFDFERQNHAAEGYVVLYTNPRGSVGYGKTFGNAIDNAYPGKDYDDLMRGVDEVIAKGYADPDNLFVYGGSGGGVLTAWIVGHTDRFRAAVSMYPVIDWISFVGTTDGPYWYTNFEKLPWEDITEHWNRSPLKYAGNVKTPTMLITGELDLRTPMSQTEEFYQALKLRKVDTVMVRVPDEYHGAAGRHVSNRLRRILYVRGWFEKYRTRQPAAEAGADRDR